MAEETQGTLPTDGKTPIVYVISDARGVTATGVVEAAADQFGEGSVVIKKLRYVNSVQMVKDFLDKNLEENVPLAVFHTIAARDLRRDIRRELDSRGVPSIDLLGPAITVLSSLTGEEPMNVTGHRSSTQVEDL